MKPIGDVIKEVLADVHALARARAEARATVRGLRRLIYHQTDSSFDLRLSCEVVELAFIEELLK